MVLAGIAQLMAFSSCTYVLYRGLPNWVMSRVASVYQLVLQATIVGGTVIWGAAADKLGIRITLLITGIAIVAAGLMKVKVPSPVCREVDVSPAMHWPEPALVIEPELEHGPVLVQIEYKIDPTRQYEFALAMKDLGSIRRRDGAFFWGIFRHDTYPDVFIESFLIESWAATTLICLSISFVFLTNVYSHSFLAVGMLIKSQRSSERIVDSYV
jgi:hypothetical protein